jgi:hypothetical protein
LNLGTWSLVLHDAGGLAQPTDQFTLFAFSGSLLNGIGSVTIDSSQVNAARWNTTGARVLSDAGRVYLTGISVVPEPSTYLLAVCGLVVLPLMRRKLTARRK